MFVPVGESILLKPAKNFLIIHSLNECACTILKLSPRCSVYPVLMYEVAYGGNMTT